MTERSLAKVGGICSILLGLMYLAGGLTYFTVSHNPAQFLQNFTHIAAGPYLVLWFYGVGALLALSAIVAITDLGRSASPGWARWMENLAFLGFSVAAVESFLAIGDNYWIASAYAATSAPVQAALATGSKMALDPLGWLTMGCVGLWLISSSIMAGVTHRFGAGHSTLGVIVGLLYWLALLGMIISAQSLITIAAVAGSIVLGPIFYIWTGATLERVASAGVPETATSQFRPSQAA
jgi:hypothetical protein